MKKIHICTIANDLNQYEEMKSSFVQAGFDEDQCRYSLFDNSIVNIYEPYSTFNQALSNTTEPYIIFCHQDVLLNQGEGFEQLVKAIDEVEKLDPTWAVLGNAGCDRYFNGIFHLTAPSLIPDQSVQYPAKVHSFDENFLVVKTSAAIRCSADLEGFHLYASDLCLNAIQQGYSCYVISFHLTHLSGGNKNQAYWDLRVKFQNRWSQKFLFCYMRSPSSGRVMCLSRYSWLRTVLDKQKMAQILLFFARKRYIRELVDLSPHTIKG